MKKFKHADSNQSIDIGIKVDSLISMLIKQLDDGEISSTEYLEKRKSINKLLERNLELLDEWKEKFK